MTVVEGGEDLDQLKPMMLSENEDRLDKELDKLLDWRKANLIVAEFFRTMQNIQKYDGWKNDPLRSKIVIMVKDLEDGERISSPPPLHVHPQT